MPQANVLRCLDIAIEVCEQLYPGPLPVSFDEEPLPSFKRQRRIAQTALTRLACVCRMLTKPALDVLWRTMYDPKFVFMILPTFCEHIEGRTVEWTWERPPTKDEWDRFDEYAWRVRELRTPVHGTVSALQYLVSHGNGQRIFNEDRPIFPRLRTLDAYDLRVPYESLSTFCSTEALRRLSLHIDIPAIEKHFWPMDGSELRYSEVQAICKAFSKYVDRIPKQVESALQDLESFKIKQTHRFLASGKTPARELIPFWTMTYLRELTACHVVELSAAKWQALAEFRHLRRLSLCFSLKLTQDERASLKLSFPLLRDLTLNCDWSDCRTVIDIMSPLPPLERFNFDVTLPHPSDDDAGSIAAAEQSTDEFLKFVCAALPKTLRRLRIDFRIQSESEYPGPTLSQVLNHIRVSPAADLHELLLILQHSYPTDNELRMLYEPDVLWPNLESLQFVYFDSEAIVEDKQKPPPTLLTLRALAQTHPRLERLRIPTINVHALPHHEHGEDDPEHNLVLLQLDTIEKTDSVAKLAAALDSLFPGLDVVDKENGDTEIDEGVDALQHELAKLPLSATVVQRLDRMDGIW